ncbi:MAG: ABC transporter ATP-binding protein [Myxococcales bacterium]
MSPLYARARGLLLPRWRLVVLAIAFAFLSALTDAGFAITAGGVAGWLFDKAGSQSSIVAAFGVDRGFGLVMGLGLIAGLRALGTLGAAWVTARLGSEIAHELRTELYERTALNALPRVLAHHRGEVVSRLQDDVETIQVTLTYSVTGIAHTVLSTLMVGSVILSIDPWVGLSCFVGAPLAALVVRLANRRFYVLYEQLRQDHGMLMGRIEEIVDAGDVVRSLGGERRVIERFTKLSERVKQASLEVARTSALTKPILSLVGALGLGVLLVYWNSGNAPAPAEQAALLAAAAILIRPLHAVSRWYEVVASTRSSFLRVDEILQTPRVELASDEPTQRPDAQALRARELAFAFGETSVFTGVSFELRRGQVLAVVGPSGSGKTTLLRLLTGSLEPATGSVEIDGKTRADMEMRSYRRHFAWVPQEARLLFDSVAENLRLGRPGASDLELSQALQAADFPLSAQHFPQGLETKIADDGSPFSVGQRQRLCIARALLTQAPFLVLDEPTAALDERTAEELHRTLLGLRERLGVCLATHRLSSVEQCDWVVVLEGGRVVEEGRPADLRQRGDRFRSLFAQDIVRLEAGKVG